MKCVYQASSTLEAHMLVGMLEQVGVLAQVQGDLLQGGVGELPAAGLATIWVAESDEDAARQALHDYDRQASECASQVATDDGYSVPIRPASFMAGLILGVLLGFVAALWLLAGMP